jgi:CheY-like chemotaxis protein
LFGLFLTHETKQTFNHFLREVFASQNEQSCEVAILSKDKPPIYAYLVGIANKSGNCEISMIDISERKQAEKKLNETNQKLEQSIQLNADKDLFVSILAHDLRNPMSVQLGFSQILLEKLSPSADEEVIGLLNEIIKSTQFTYLLLEDILKWSTLRMGRIPFEPQIFNPNVICTEIINSLYPIANTKGIILGCNIEKETSVVADKEMLKAILRNLVSNAIKFTNRNGQIKVAAEPKNSSVIFSVTDSGVGIPPERLEKLFEISKFQSTAGTLNEKGNGLGLLLCKDFVEKHGGRIWAESECGQGSVFYFEIPTRDISDVKTDSERGTEQTRINNLKVLIVDDNAGLRIILGSMVHNYCKEIFYAESGIEAVDVFTKKPDIDLILMDISMPGMNGSEAINLIRRINKKVVIIVETGKTLAEIKEESIKGIDDYFFKPYNRIFLKKLIFKHFDNKTK